MERIPGRMGRGGEVEGGGVEGDKMGKMRMSAFRKRGAVARVGDDDARVGED